MPKFDKDSACAKCRATGASVEYHAGSEGRDCTKVFDGDQPHMHRICAQCHYQWSEEPLA